MLDAVHVNAPPCEVTAGIQTIGAYSQCNGGLFNGYIDQLSILFNRAKSASEILDDATLVAYYSMDCTSFPAWDSGPNLIHGTAVGLTMGDGGRIGQSYLFTSNSSYFQASGFILLGQSWSPFSLATWIRPTGSVTNGGSIAHISQYTDGTGWCLPFLGLSSSGQIVANLWNGSAPVSVIGPVLTVGQWVHVVQTYSTTNGMRLYVNGVLSGQSTIFAYGASGVPMSVILGQALNGLNNCATGSIQAGYYRGEIDEFYIYSRELSQASVTALASP